MVALGDEVVPGDVLRHAGDELGCPAPGCGDVVNPGYYWPVTYARRIGCDDARRAFADPPADAA
jgi:hypothetical protein